MLKLRIVLAMAVALVCLGVVLHFIFPPSYVGICANTNTQVRLPDQDCQPVPGSGRGWVYYSSGDAIPAVGARADDGSADAPEGNVTRGGVPARGEQADDSNVGNSGGGDGGGDDGVDPGDGGGDDDDGGGSGGSGSGGGGGGGGDDGE